MPLIAVAVVLVLWVLASIGLLVAAVIGIIILPTMSATQTGTPAAALLNRLAVIDDGAIYTIAPDGSQRVDLAQSGSVPTAAVIWSRDGQHLIFVESERGRTRVTQARPDGQGAAILYEAARPLEPFYLAGSPDDQRVAFLAPDEQTGMQLRIAQTDQPNSARSAVSGQPNYTSWSPDGQALLVHVGGTNATSYVGAYDVAASDLQKIEGHPAAFQAPGWSPNGKTQWLYARQSGAHNELVLDTDHIGRALTQFDGGIAFGWSPDGQHVAYALNTPDSFLFSDLTVIDLADASSRVVFDGNVLAFFWSPNGQQIAYLTGVLVEPSSIGRAAGAAAPVRERTLQITWHVIDLTRDRTIDLNTFEPTSSFLYLIQYFDQFAQSVAVWSPDSRSLVYTGQPLIGERGVYTIDTQDSTAAPRFVGPGDFAIWSWH